MPFVNGINRCKFTCRSLYRNNLLPKYHSNSFKQKKFKSIFNRQDSAFFALKSNRSSFERGYSSLSSAIPPEKYEKNSTNDDNFMEKLAKYPKNSLSERLRLWDQEYNHQVHKKNYPVTNKYVGFPDGEKVIVEDIYNKRFQDLYNIYIRRPDRMLKSNSSALAVQIDGIDSLIEMQDTVGSLLMTSNEYLKINSSMQIHDHENETEITLRIIKWITFDDPEGKKIFWHSSAHVLGASIELLCLEKWIEEGLTCFDNESLRNGNCDFSSIESLPNRIIPLLDDGPALPDPPGGFFYDFFINKHLKEEDFKKIDEIANDIIRKKSNFIRINVSKDTALKLFAYNPLKIQIIQKIPDSSLLTIYRCSETPFLDLCRGPHLPHSGLLQAFKTLKSSSIYYRENSKNPCLQRIYAISFPEHEMLEKWDILRKECEANDHRVIGKNQKLFVFNDYSPGSPFFLPNGTIIFNKLIQVIRDQYKSRGYDEVITPLVFSKELWQTSGHWEHYKENMFLLDLFEAKDDDGGHTCSGLKPMNCPAHCLIFKSDARSYRDLPIRYADFSSLHRNELKGALTGLTRLRRFHQDDAHIFCTIDQIEDELYSVLEMVDYFYNKIFEFPSFEILISTRPEKSIGSKEDWEKAESALINAVSRMGKQYTINSGDGAFYGPKIDFVISDSYGRKVQCATIQADFQLPQRFDLKYIDSDGTKKTPVIIHRAVLGSLERMFAILIENYRGKWPLWLSPMQVAVCTVSEKFKNYGKSVFDQLNKSGYNTHLYDENLKLQNKIRMAQSSQYNYIVVVGKVEMEKKILSIRKRSGELMDPMNIQQFQDYLQSEIKIWK